MAARERDSLLMNQLIISPQGEVRRVRPNEGTVYEDRKKHLVDGEGMIKLLMEAQRISQEMSVSQREATVEVKPLYSRLPIYIWLNCDDHLGSVLINYHAFWNDYKTVRDTPNFFCINNGDEVDNFMVHLGAASTGVYEDVIPPGDQALLMRNLFKTLDESGKVLCFSFGNHNQWVKGSGYKFEETWLRDFKCPVLNCGGLLRVKYGQQEYKMAITHRHWGQSKLNPTNSAKRFMEHVCPEADFVFLGHTHVTEVLRFKRANEGWRYAVIGGTYKTDDEWAAQAGIGGGGNLGGLTLKIWPDEKRMDVIPSVSQALEDFSNLLEIEKRRREQKS